MVADKSKEHNIIISLRGVKISNSIHYSTLVGVITLLFIESENYTLIQNAKYNWKLPILNGVWLRKKSKFCKCIDFNQIMYFLIFLVNAVYQYCTLISPNCWTKSMSVLSILHNVSIVSADLYEFKMFAVHVYLIHWIQNRTQWFVIHFYRLICYKL